MEMGHFDFGEGIEKTFSNTDTHTQTYKSALCASIFQFLQQFKGLNKCFGKVFAILKDCIQQSKYSLRPHRKSII